MKRTAFAVILIFVLLFSSAELVKMAKANAAPIYWGLFYSNYDEVEPVPCTIPPSITIYGLQNNTVYSSTNMTVNLCVRNAELAGWQSSVTGVYYYLDGQGEILYFHWIDERFPVFDTTFNLSLSTGKHCLTVEAYVDVLRPSEVFFLTTNSTVFFTVEDRVSSPNPSPSQLSTPTPEPTATPGTLLSLESFPASLVVASSFTAAVVLVGLGLLLYGIKRKR